MSTRLSIFRLIQVLLGSAAIGVLFCLAAGVISIVIAIHGTPNHISGTQLLWVFAAGFGAGLPVVWLWMGRRTKNAIPGEPTNVT
jgi:hypothetical protein